MYVCTYIEYKEKSCCLTSKETAFYYFGPTPQGGERRGIEEWLRPQWVEREAVCTLIKAWGYILPKKKRERGSKAMETVHNIYCLLHPPPPHSLRLPLLIPLYKPLGTLCKFLSASTMGHWRRGREREWTGSLKGFRTGCPMTSVCPF